MSDYTIRRAQSAEFEMAGEVTLAAYAHDGMSHAEYDEVLRDARRRAEAAELLVAVDDDGMVLGTVTFCRAGSEHAEVSRPGEAEFRMLGVAPSARGAGVGEALVRACVDRARQAGDRAIVLSTQPSMATAHRIYERLGFRRAPERDWQPIPDAPLIAYQLDL